MNAVNADLSWAEYRVCWQLQVRKYFCLNQQCKRRIFTEQLPSIVAPWARRTQRLATQLSAIGERGRRCARKQVAL